MSDGAAARRRPGSTASGRDGVADATTGLHVVVLGLFAGLLLVQAFTTLEWRMEHDTPLLHYAAQLMDRFDLVPYRDIFETSMPGTFAFHRLVGGLFGYGDTAFRHVDLALLGLLFTAGYLFARHFGRFAALWPIVIFGLVYFSYGQHTSLQRDHIGVIPVAWALVCIPATAATPVRLWRFATVGFLFGLSVLIKPHLGIALPVMVGALLALRRRTGTSRLDALRCTAVTAAASLVPIGAALAWLARRDALAPFLDVFFDYLPLHSSLTGDHQTIAGLARVRYLLNNATDVGGFGALSLAALGAYAHAVTRPARDRAITVSLTCLGLCTLAYAAYPVLAGKFWSYHYMPFVFFGSLSTGLWLFGWERSGPAPASAVRRAVCVAVPVVALWLQLPLRDSVDTVAADLRSGPEAHAPKRGRADEIGAWLADRLQPGDTVQPLDWTGGSVHGMLLAEARLATDFLYDYHFYHHVSEPLIQQLRASFMVQLRAAMPRFVIALETDKPWVGGDDTTRAFPELEQFLASFYAPAHAGDGYTILERTSIS